MSNKKIKHSVRKVPPFISILSTYQSVVGKIMSKQEIQDKIKSLYVGSMISVLSKLCARELDDKEIVRRFKEYCILSGRGGILTDEDRIICSQQGLMLLWKWIIAFGNVNTIDKFNNHEEEDEIFLNIIVLNMALIDHYQPPLNQEIQYDMFRNLFFNHTPQGHSSLVRSVYLYTRIASKEEYFSQKEFIDINDAFTKSYGYTIREYLHVLTTLWSAFGGESKKNRTAMTITLDYFSSTPFRDTAQKVLRELSLPLIDRKDWAIDSLDHRWNFKQFIEKPLLEVENGRYLSFNMKILEELLLNQFYFKIRQLYSKQDTQILSFMGRCFEKYAEIIAEKAVGLSKIPYKLIKEFKFNKGDKSPDILLKLDDKLLAVEVKGSRLSLDSIISEDSQSIDKDLNRMINSPMKQLYNCIRKLKQINHIVLEGVQEIHLAVVNFGGVPTFKPFEDSFQEIKNSFEIPIASIHHLEISEYEVLMGLIADENPKQIFRVLNNKLQLFKNDSFANFYYKSSFGKKGSQLIKDLFSECMDETIELIKDHQSKEK